MKSHSCACLLSSQYVKQSLLLVLTFLMSAQAITEPLLNGLAVHSELGKERFIAALYMDSPSSDHSTLLSANEHKRMELRITAKRLSSRRLNSMWIEGLAINVPGSLLTKHAENMVKFTGMFKGKLVSGDIVAIDVAPGEGTTVAVNGIELGSIVADGFFELLLRTWIGSVPLSSDFRDQILKFDNVDAELLARYQTVSPQKKRFAEIEAWRAPKIEKTVEETAITLVPASDIDIKVPTSKPMLAPPDLVQAPTLPPAETLAATVPAPLPKPQPAEDVVNEDVVNNEQVEAEVLLDEDELENDGPALTGEILLNRQLYHSKLLKWTYKYLSYPQRALKRGQQGSVRLSVIIDREGNVKGISPLEESRFAMLNREAMGAVKRAEPFPPVPEVVDGEEFEFSLPIVFKLPK